MTALASMPAREACSAQATASVVIAGHTEERITSMLRAIRSAQAQVPAPAQVIVAVDHNPRLCEMLAAVEGIIVVDHQGEPGASGTRNAGAALAGSELLVFLDDDTEAHPGWLAHLIAPFADPAVIGSGGMTHAVWQSLRPRWFPDEFGWVVGASHVGLPTTVATVRNVWSENMAVRRVAFEAVGGFRQGFGKVGHKSRPEDTDLCIRVGAAVSDGHWVYVPTAVVDHDVPATRATLRFFLRRCYWEGAGKVELSSHLGDDRDLGDERSYLLRVLPLGVVRHLGAGRVTQSLAIIAGIAMAAAGGAGALLSTARVRRPR